MGSPLRLVLVLSIAACGGGDDARGSGGEVATDISSITAATDGTARRNASTS